ncbi:leucine-rich repeat protein [Kineothrix sp. MSJ-39]|uniref:leucine-rich repeat protein n=1 Tax=Kineothrix sp. MSJ-39 TaxID=2841533 RepID=UPI001C127246|nr:leucine-rich repeat protein [Kineothrix sp. MSJ-39]MBU5429183.1 leucine-rich repeat protein [Kineothrix sp. MSJ-39]
MKRKVSKWFTCCMLTVSLFAGSLQQLRAASVTGQTETVSANATLSGNAAEAVDESGQQENMTDDDLFLKNPIALTEEELEYCLNAYGDEEIAVWLDCLSENEQMQLLEKSDRLKEPLDYYGEEICRECGMVDGAHFDDNLSYYQTIAACDKVGDTYFSSKSGFYYIEFDGPQAGKATIKISGIDKTKPFAKRQNAMSTTVSGAKYGLKITGKGVYTYQIETTKEQAQADVAKLKKGGSITYPHAMIQFSMVKPLGYAFSVEASTEKDSSSRGATYPLNSTAVADDSYTGVRYLKNGTYRGEQTYEAEKTVAFEQYIYLPTNAGVGSTAITNPAKIHNMVFHFAMKPAAYRVIYDGNGGGGAPGAIDCVYGKDALYPAAPGISPFYTLTVNPNGAEGMAAPVTAVRSFVNWGDTGAVPGAVFRNLTTKNGGVVTKRANWSSNASCILPAQLHREYTITYNTDGGDCEQAMSVTKAAFLGWYADAGKKSKIGNALQKVSVTGNMVIYAGWGAGENILLPDAKKEGYHLLGWAEENNMTKLYLPGTNYSPGQSHTLYAKWEADRYMLRLDPSGGSLSEDASKDFVKKETGYERESAYEEIIALPQPVRQGYVFKGWRTKEGFLLTESASRLTGEENGVITLQAEYVPSYVKYEVQYYLQPDEKETEQGKYLAYHPQTTGQEGKALADTQVRIFPITINGYEKPDSQLVTVKADGSTVVKFYYRKLPVKTEQTSGEREKPDNGLSAELQKKILEALEQGSSTSYTINEVTYTLRKNEDGTLTILLNGSLGKEKLVIPDVIKVAGKTMMITEIAEKAFYGRSELKEVVMGSGITKIGDSAFENCKNLTKISIGDHVTVIGEKAFKNCTALTKISVPKSVLRIGNNAFEGCNKLKELTLRNGLLQIGNKAFYQCAVLKSVKIPKSVLQIGKYAFADCSRLGKFTFAQDASLLRVGTGMLQNAVSLKKVKLPDKLQTIPDYMFRNAGKLESCQLGTGTVKIGKSVFQGCKKLQKITLTEQVQTIGKRAFYQCRKLKKVTIRTVQLRKVGKEAFQGCMAKIRFAVPKEKQTAYAKLLRGKYGK